MTQLSVETYYCNPARQTQVASSQIHFCFLPEESGTLEQEKEIQVRSSYKETILCLCLRPQAQCPVTSPRLSS